MPSKPDYSRIGNVEDGHIIKQADKKKLKPTSGIDYTDPEIYVNYVIVVLLCLYYVIFSISKEICH